MPEYDPVTGQNLRNPATHLAGGEPRLRAEDTGKRFPELEAAHPGLAEELGRLHDVICQDDGACILPRGVAYLPPEPGMPGRMMSRRARASVRYASAGGTWLLTLERQE